MATFGAHNRGGSIGLWLLAAVLTQTCSATLVADECKLWDFEKPKNGVADTGAQMTLISWNGGTEQECRRVRDSIAARIKKRRDEVKGYASAAKERADKAYKEWLNAPGPQQRCCSQEP